MQPGADHGVVPCLQFLPLLYVLGSVGLCMALNQSSYIPFIVLGTYNSWLYLRFFQQQPDSQHKGDSSDDFKFSGFFPSILALVLDPIGILCSTVFRLRHQPAETKAPFAGAAQYSLGSDNADANRRRSVPLAAACVRGLARACPRGRVRHACSARVPWALPACAVAVHSTLHGPRPHMLPACGHPSGCTRHCVHSTCVPRSGCPRLHGVRGAWHAAGSRTHPTYTLAAWLPPMLEADSPMLLLRGHTQRNRESTPPALHSVTSWADPLRALCRERGAKALEERLMKKPSGAAEGDVEAVAAAPPPPSEAS